MLLTTLIVGNAHAESSVFTQEQQSQIEKIASQYIINNPEILIRASESLQKQQIEQQQSMMKEMVVKNINKLINNKSTPYIGPDNAQVNVIEFFDYQCGYCAKMSPVLKVLQNENPTVKFIYKETPIFASRWEGSEYAASMGNWVFKQKGSKGYNLYHEGIYSLNKSGGELTTQDVNAVAKKSGVDVSKFKKTDSINENLQLFSSLGFQGTPALIVMPSRNITKENIYIINGYDPQALTDALKKVKASL